MTTDPASLRLRNVQAIEGVLDFTTRDGSTGALFWGPLGDWGYAIFFEPPAGDIRRLQNIASANASARATTIVNKGIL